MNTDFLERKPGIYKITNIINDKVYIGSAINVRSRCQWHKKDLKGRYHTNRKLQNSHNKYGEENFIFEVLEYIENVNKLIEREQFYLDTILFASSDRKKFNTLGFNISPTAGSSLGVKHTEETKKRCSERNRGAGNGMYGKNHSEETKKIIAEVNKGRKFSKEECVLRSLRQKGKKPWNVGVPQKEETIQKIKNNLSDRFSGTKSFLYGGGQKSIENKLKKKVPFIVEGDHFDKSVNKSGRTILQYDGNMTFLKEWGSIKSASDALNITRHGIQKCCEGKNRHAGFYIWRYKDTPNVVYKFRSNPFFQINDKDEIIGEFDQIIEAAIQLKINRKGISNALKTGNKYCGFLWIHKKDYTSKTDRNDDL